MDLSPGMQSIRHCDGSSSQIMLCARMFRGGITFGHIAGNIAFGEVLVLPRSSAKTRELRYFGGHRCRHRPRGIHGSEVISLGQRGFESFSIVRCRSVVLRPGDAHM
jgi:hypothetical protein